MRIPIRSLIAAAMVLSVPLAVGAKPDADAAEETAAKLRRIVASYDMNRQEKFIIDFHFSPLHAMYAYRELLLWAAGAEMPAELREEIHATVEAGLRAVFLESGAGVPQPGASGAIGVAFERSLPRYAETPDAERPESLRWRPENMEQTAGPASIGQSMAAKALWLRQANVGDGRKRPIRKVLETELETVTATPFARASGPSVPERLRWTGKRWQMVDGRSRLFSQSSLLLGLLEVRELLADGSAAAGLAGKWEKPTKRAVARLFEALKRHRDPETGALVDSYEPGQGRGDRVMLEDLALASQALGALARSGSGALAEEARALLTAQAEFVVGKLDGRSLAPRGWMLPSGTPWTGTVTTLGEQLAAVRVLLEGASASGPEGLRDAALAHWALIQEPFWSEPAGIYRSSAGYTVSAYDGYLFGTVMGMLRRLETAGAVLPVDGKTYFEVVLKRSGLLQSEGKGTGEPADPGRLIDREAGALAAELSGLNAEEKGRRMTAFISRLMDRDRDSVPGVLFGGGEFGAAPVLVIQTSVRTPFEPRGEPRSESRNRRQ